MPSSRLILCRPLLLLPPIPPSIRIFSNESTLRMRWPNYWSFSISPSSEYSGLISFRIDWFDLFVVQGTLKSLLQHHSSIACSLLQGIFPTQGSNPGLLHCTLQTPWGTHPSDRPVLGHALLPTSHRDAVSLTWDALNTQLTLIVISSWKALPHSLTSPLSFLQSASPSCHFTVRGKCSSHSRRPVSLGKRAP